MTSPKPSAEVPARLEALRRLVAERGLAAYVVPSADPHQSEYAPACWLRREWASGFSGSAGTAVVLHERALLWADARYWLQAAAEIEGSGYEVMRQGAPEVPDVIEWLAEHLPGGAAVGVDPEVLSRAQEERWSRVLEESGRELRLVEPNLVDLAWDDLAEQQGERPARPTGRLHPLSDRFAGESTAEKLGHVREALKAKHCDALVVSALDQVAWLFNVRGEDVDYNPVGIAHALVTQGDTWLFTDAANAPAIDAELPDEVSVEPYGKFAVRLDELAKRKVRVWVEPDTCSAWTAARLHAGGSTLHEDLSPITRRKAVKNETELAGMRSCHVRDGAALVRFFTWLEASVERGESVSELDAAEKLAGLRSEGEHFQGLSFPSISAFGPHGAIVHYRPLPAPDGEGDVAIDGSSLYLLDSGGQYLDGTTDVTRTLCLGTPTPEQVDRFTRVLAGHVELAMTTFPKGTTGKHLDALARLPLWRLGLNYGHGTGHGVGAFLNVHEGPQGISPKARDVELEPGMILSNEPGYYAAERWGIRTESLVIVVDRPDLGADDETWLGFETITACPIDARLIEPSLLSDDQRRWIDDYHAWVRETLAPVLGDDDAARSWLERATQPLA